MDEALNKSGEWPNVALIPGTHTHAATGEHVEQPENTRIGRSRGACRPISTPSDSEPADVENGAQNGLERVETRKELENAVLACCYSYRMPYDVVFNWLDRQAAITRREFDGECEFCQSEVARLQEQLDSLTAENNNLRSRNSFLNDTMTEQIAELLDENDCIEVSERGIDGKRRLVTGTQRKLESQLKELTAERDELREKNRRQRKQLSELQGAIHERNDGVLKRQWQQQIDELTAERDELERANSRQARKIHDVCEINEKLAAERDDLRSRLKTQADSFAKLERDNAQLRDKLERVREMAGGDA